MNGEETMAHDVGIDMDEIARGTVAEGQSAADASICDREEVSPFVEAFPDVQNPPPVIQDANASNNTAFEAFPDCQVDVDGPKTAELIALQKIDTEATSLQQEGRYSEALERMEKGLVLRQHFFGSDSAQVWQACKTVGEMCNLLAMTYLQQEEFPVVLELLKKAEILSERDPAGRAVTLNNLACYHRRQGNLHAALTSLTHALKIEGELDNIPNRADTHLNMCAVLSQLGKHQAALEHAQSALILLHEELFLDSHEQLNGIEDKADRIAVLAIAYHNVGAEYEFLKKRNLSVQSYQKGAEMAEKYLGAEHGIVITLKASLVSLKSTSSGTKKSIKQKQKSRKIKSNKVAIG